MLGVLAGQVLRGMGVEGGGNLREGCRRQSH